MAELLLQSGAQVDAVEVMRRSPLMYCLLYDHAEAAKLLLRWVRGALGACRMFAPGTCSSSRMQAGGPAGPVRSEAVPAAAGAQPA